MCWRERERVREPEDKAWKSWHIGAVVPPVPPCAPDEGSMVEWWRCGGPWQHKDPLWSQWSGAQPCRGDPQSLEGEQRPSYEAAWERLGHCCHYYCHCPHYAWESCMRTAKEMIEWQIGKRHRWENMRRDQKKKAYSEEDTIIWSKMDILSCSMSKSDLWWAHKGYESLLGFPHKQKDTDTYTHSYQSTRDPYAIQQLEGLLSQTQSHCAHARRHTSTCENKHPHTQLYVIILQSTSKASGIEIPFLSVFSIWWQKGEQGANSCTYN